MLLFGGNRRMRILILSWYFPPINEIGAIRVGRLADYLHAKGHDVWVVTARREQVDASLTHGLASDHVIRTRWIDVDRLSSPWTWFGRRAQQSEKIDAPAPAAPAPQSGGLRERIGRHYMWLVRFPDRQGGWLPFLRRAGGELLKRRGFDLIYASGPPFTTFVAASRLSRRFGVPWIAEYRDGWSHYSYTPKPEWRERIDAFLERRITGSATGLVAVSQPWADYYEAQFHKPTAAIYNGFDPVQRAASPRVSRPGLPVSIVHMGTIYPGLRDPSLLFEAIRLANLTPGEVEVAFYGAGGNTVLPLAARHGVQDFVKVPPRVPYQRALEIQAASDVLLLLQSPADMANVPAKTFEYFAARRPILGLGLDEGIPARLVRERNAGLYRTDAGAIAKQLIAWVAQKRVDGVIPALAESASAGLSREEQFERLESFLAPLAKSTERLVPHPPAHSFAAPS